MNKNKFLECHNTDDTKTIREYDADGFLVKKEYYNTDGSLYTIQRYEHKTEGKLAQIEIYNAEGNICTICHSRGYTEHEYDEAGNLIKRKHLDAYGNLIKQEHFDADGELISTLHRR
ncbi:MAG: hypothetical protein OXF49_01280 [Candidatus Saccharibacteria bacterium]|nr:hypothetical protein [Candidatus Saccharibacteria bacterium]MCY4088744.1 hypothetical protein [Candidatus Saccharibacteria bacterium]